MQGHDTYMQRCLQLAAAGAGSTAPNPMVGAVLVHEGRIIGEGFTQPYGQAHAEVMCIGSVLPADEALVAQATLYVSLEPCAHVGKTPPCTSLIISKKIPRVVIGCSDPFEQVNGRGIALLEAAGIEVITGVQEAACRAMNRRFFTFHTQQRPYVLLKWAQSADGKTDAAGKRTAISGTLTNRLVHRWRSEEAAIMVGARTALADNPQLTTRLWPGKHPVRIVAAGNTSLPGSLHLFDGAADTHVLTATVQEQVSKATCHQLPDSSIAAMLAAVYSLNLNSVLVEGGPRLLQAFISSGLWDEARVITNTALHLGTGTAAPQLQHAQLHHTEKLQQDTISYFTHAAPVAAHNQPHIQL